jgi:chaperonin cofactor prefoldin
MQINDLSLQLQDIIASLEEISKLENEAHVFAQAGE